MRHFSVDSSHDIEKPPVEIVENVFANADIKNGEIVVENTENNVLERIVVAVEDDIVSMSISEISVEKLQEESLDDEVEEAVKSKNELLRRLTGKSVSQRKKEIRDDVLPDSDWVDYSAP